MLTDSLVNKYFPEATDKISCNTPTGKRAARNETTTTRPQPYGE